jgi:DNA-binding transcriptional LysR family regulator
MLWEDRIGRRIKLRDLHVLMAVAEAGSMAKAAERLSISHPVVSKAISAMEHTLGVPLFDRTARGVELTAYGYAMLKSGTAVFDEMRQGVRRIEALSDPDSGTLRFGCPEAMAGGLMQELLARFIELHPAVTLDIVTADTVVDNFRELRARQVEFLIGRIRIPFEDDELSAEVLGHEGLVIVAGHGHPLAGKGILALADLLDQPWSLPPPDSLPGAFARTFFRDRGLDPPKPRVVTMSLHINLNLLAGSRFLCVLPSTMLLYGPARTIAKRLPIDLPELRSSLGAITVRNRTLSPLAERFLTLAREVTLPLKDVSLLSPVGVNPPS